MKNQKGFSLVEMVAVLGLVGIIGVVVMNVTGDAFKTQKKVSTRMDIHSDLVILENVLSNMINTLDMRMTFTGPGLPMTLSTSESRFLIPLPGLCRDLSNTNCNLDTSLMFANHKTKNNPAVDVVCNYNAPHSRFPNPPSLPTPNNYKIFVINANRTTYGTNSVSMSPSQITSSGADLSKPGVIKLADDEIFSIFDGTSSSLWRVTKGLQHFNAPSSPMALLLLSFSLPNCYSRLGLPGNNNIYYFFGAPLAPNHLVTNYSTDLRTDILKLNNVGIMTIGRKETDKTFGINKCVFSSGPGKITCSEESKFPKLKNVVISRMDQEFRLPVSPQTQLMWYEIGAPCSNPAICNVGSETAMAMDAVPPGLSRQMFTSREIQDVPFLLGPKFSFYKQEFLHRIRFRLKQENKRRDVYIRFF